MFRTKNNIARYVSKTEATSIVLEVAFSGGAEKPGQENPKDTNITARCLKKANIHWPASPWIEKWNKDYGNQIMPSGAWNGIKLVEIINSRTFLAISNNLLEVDPETGEAIWSLETGNTPIYHIMSSTDKGALIIHNGYYEFNDENNLGNIVAVNVNGKVIWRVSLPSENDIFANPPYYEKGILKSASWKGFTCSINEENGSIINQEFTK